jgi:hypothetical protein
LFYKEVSQIPVPCSTRCQTYTVAGVTVFKKNEEQSAAAEDGEGAAPLAMTARRQLSRAHVGLIVSEKAVSVLPKALP